jgi:serine phosphatase RsbU (regulator of sigma subunit)/tRNA A-37 threonylcarbamoyl transferase component Bud32
MGVPKDELDLPDLQIMHKIGGGVEGIVYKALSTRNPKRLCAVKVRQLDAGASAESKLEAKKRFRREAAAQARLNHPGLVKVLTTGESDARDYLVMDYVEGISLSEQIRQAPLSEKETVRIARILAGALGEVHGQGFIHRDIKPDNILLEANGNPKLIDFGMATDTQASRNQGLTGTFVYSPPEQFGVLKRPVDGRSDLYSLGATLFECVTGRIPYKVERLEDLIQAHLSSKPPLVTELQPACTAAFAAIIAKLLAKDPDDRYPNAEALTYDLDRIDEINARAAAGTPIALGSTGSDFDVLNGAETPLIGRKTELQRLLTVGLSAIFGQGSAILVNGEPGSGKSRLIAQALKQMNEFGHFTLFSAKCNEAQPVPLAPIRGAIEGLIKGLEHMAPEAKQARIEHIIKAAGDSAAALAMLSPKLAAILDAAEDGAGPSSAQTQYHTMIADFLLRLSKQLGGSVFFLDDLQWIDEGSWKVISQVAKLSHDFPIWVVFTGRSNPESVETVQKLADEIRPQLSETLNVGGLSRESVAQLITSQLGGYPASQDLVDQVAKRSDGIPLAVKEYLRAMLDEGLIQFQWGTWVADVQRIQSLDLPQDVVHLILKRVELLQDEVKPVLSAAALLGSRFSSALLPPLCSSSPERVLAALSEAIRAQLIEQVDTNEYCFIHDRVQEALLSGLGADPARELHQKIAELLEEPGDGERDLDSVYRKAKHYGLGRPEKNPSAATEANVLAGRRAIENFAPEEGYLFLCQAWRIAEAHALESRFSVARRLGEVCVQIARTDEALVHLNRALGRATDPVLRAAIYGDISRAYLVHLDTSRSREAMELAFAELGESFPTTSVASFVKTFKDLFIGAFMAWARVGWGKAEGARREQLRTLILLYQQTGYILYLDANSLPWVQSIWRQHRIAIALGDCVETVRALSAQTLVYGALRIWPLAKHFYKTAISLAERVGDPVGIGRTMGYEMVVQVYSGNLSASYQIASSAMQKYGRWYDGMDFLMTAATLSWLRMFQGYTQEGLGLIERHIREWEQRQTSAMKEQDNDLLWLRLIACLNLASLGRAQECRTYLQEIAGSFQKQKIPRLHQGLLYFAELIFAFEQEDFKSVDSTIESYRELKLVPALAPYLLQTYYIVQAYARLKQLRAAKEGDRKRALALLKKAVSELKPVALTPGVRAHLMIIQASVAHIEGRLSKATQLLAKAEDAGNEVDSPWIQFEVCAQRARILESQGRSPGSFRSAGIALGLAQKFGWVPHARRLKQEFPTLDPLAAATGSAGLISSRSFVQTTSTAAASDLGSMQLKRQLDSLLQLSLSSSLLIQPEAQAKAALDEIVKILGAERAFLFVVDEKTDTLKVSVGRSLDKTDIKTLQGHSSTVVERVFRGRKPMVLNGAEEGELLGSKSIAAHDLRSIAAAPLMVRDKMLGVVYLDNRLVKGLFTNDDLDILMGLSNHIAIAMQTAQSAQVEIERKALEKDLELTGVVQSLLLPPMSSLTQGSFRLAAHYQPASRSGGDWWWSDELPDGKVRLFLGDVTGHGAGSAMMTAAVAGSYHALRSMRQKDGSALPMEAELEILNQNLTDISQGKYGMSMAALELDAASSALTAWCAGSPPVYVMRNSGEVDALMETSSPLGSLPMYLGRKQRKLESGERIFVFTDGAYEFTADDGRPFGRKRLIGLLQETRGMPLEKAWVFLKEKLVSLPSGPAEDDLTFVLVDYLRPGA